MHIDLTGKFAVIAGGGGRPGEESVGKTIALSLARAGAHCCILDKDEAAAHVTKEEIERRVRAVPPPRGRDAADRGSSGACQIAGLR